MRDETNIIDIRAPYDTARRFQSALATRLCYHREPSISMTGAALAEADEAALRSQLYKFLDQCQRKTAKETRPVKPNVPMVGALLMRLRAAAHLDEKVGPRMARRRGRSVSAETVACSNGLLHLTTLTADAAYTLVFHSQRARLCLRPTAPGADGGSLVPSSSLGDDPEAIAALQEIFGYVLTAKHLSKKRFY